MRGVQRGRETRLVVISLPLFRIARVTLSDLVLGELRQSSDVAVVAPFADVSAFVATFDGPNTRFIKWQMPKLSRAQRLLYAASEIMRQNGYWGRFAKSFTAYFARNQYRVFGEHGKDTRMSWPRAAAYWLLSRLGRSDNAWQLPQRLLGDAWCDLPELVTLSRQYQSVTLIQSANWGMQDRALSVLSKREQWRTVLVPYTTDQLYVNGYLLNSFDQVCVQGRFEQAAAERVHRIPAGRIRPLGSVWLRHLAQIRGQLAAETDGNAVIYAGVSPLYYPRESELAAVDCLADFLRQRYPGYVLVYRPVEFDDAARQDIERRYQDSGVVVKWPAPSDLGLHEYAAVEHEAALANYVRGLIGCRVLVMSTNTTLCVDAAFLARSGIVSCRIDTEDVLRQRHTHLLDRSWFPQLRVAHTTDEMLAHVELLLRHPETAAEEATRLLELWDFDDVDFRTSLHSAVYGVKPRAEAIC